MNALTEYLNGARSLKFALHFRRRPDSSWRCVGGMLTLYVTLLVTIAGVAQQSSSVALCSNRRRRWYRSGHTCKASARRRRCDSRLSCQQRKRDDVQLHLSLGVLLASEKQYKAAQLELEKADALQPGTFEILFNLGQASLRNGDNQNAELALSRALKLKPESPETLYLLAQVYTNESRPLDALDLLVRANKLAPENPDILYLMAQISISQKYYEDAMPLLEKAFRSLRSALIYVRP